MNDINDIVNDINYIMKDIMKAITNDKKGHNKYYERQ